MSKTIFILFGALLALAFITETSYKAFQFYRTHLHDDVVEMSKKALAFTITAGAYTVDSVKYIYKERNNIRNTVGEVFVYRSPIIA